MKPVFVSKGSLKDRHLVLAVASVPLFKLLHRKGFFALLLANILLVLDHAGQADITRIVSAAKLCGAEKCGLIYSRVSVGLLVLQQ